MEEVCLISYEIRNFGKTTSLVVKNTIKILPFARTLKRKVFVFQPREQFLAAIEFP